MRTTLDIADDVLFAARDIAQREKKPLGHIISELVRQAFRNPPPAAGQEPSAADSNAVLVAERLASYGIQPLAHRGGIVSNELIDRLRDAEGV